jgi:hypothetical protein
MNKRRFGPVVQDGEEPSIAAIVDTGFSITDDPAI